MQLRLLLCVTFVCGCATRDPGDLTLDAHEILAVAEVSTEVLTLADLLGPEYRTVEVPSEIRVWRRGLGGSETSCEGRVDVLALEDYVAGVVPSEWMPHWTDASLEAGAVAARTYGAFWVQAGGRYECADVDDTTWTQVYRDGRYPATDAAVARTAGEVAVRRGSLVFAEYSAEHGGSTAYGVSDPHCANQAIDGHGRGLCQWGTERWAHAGKDAAWMIAHYYDGARVAVAGVEAIAMEVRSGERFQLSLAATGEIGTDASAFVDDSWVSEEQPLVRAGSWWMRAPEVEEPTTFDEVFWLDGAAEAVGRWEVTVLPPEPEPEPEPSAWAWLWAWWPFSEAPVEVAGG